MLKTQAFLWNVSLAFQSSKMSEEEARMFFREYNNNTVLVIKIIFIFTVNQLLFL